MKSLRVVHLLKSGSSTPEYRSARPAFVLDSCQRKLWVEMLGAQDHASSPGPAFTVFTGIQAYAFLLSVATGLESQIVGETDIFGQIKEAWKQQLPRLDADLKKSVSPWMQRLFEDTKEIRSLYLQNLGGSSYGSLLRKLLKDHQSLAKGPTLLIGAGQLAHSVAPYLLEHELVISNRSPEKAFSLQSELLAQNPGTRVRMTEGFEDELAELARAAQVIVCVPLDPSRDEARIQVLSASTAHVVHLGIRAGEKSDWTSVPGLHSLDEIFQIEKSINAIRSVQVDKARLACHEKATLRALGGGSVSIAHGWEDLAAFVS